MRNLWEDEQLHHQFQLVERESGMVLEDSIEIHTVELAKYNGGLGEVRGASVLEQWAYWIKNAGEHTVEELCELLPGLEFLRATGELNAIREITEEKQIYDAREKARLNIQSNLIDAKQEGIAIGEQRGKLTGSIQVYEGLIVRGADNTCPRCSHLDSTKQDSDVLTGLASIKRLLERFDASTNTSHNLTQSDDFQRITHSYDPLINFAGCNRPSTRNRMNTFDVGIL